MADQKKQVGLTIITLKSGQTIQIPRYTESNLEKPAPKQSGGGGGYSSARQQSESELLQASFINPSAKQAAEEEALTGRNYSTTPALETARLQRQGYVILPEPSETATLTRIETRGPTQVTERFVPPRQQTATLARTPSIGQSGLGLYTPLREQDIIKEETLRGAGAARGLPFMGQPLRAELASQLTITGREKSIEEIELGTTPRSRKSGEIVEAVPFDIAGGIIFPESIVGTGQRFISDPGKASREFAEFATTPRGALGIAGSFFIGGGGFKSVGKPKITIGGALGKEVGVTAASSTLVEDLGGGLSRTTIKNVGSGTGELTLVEPSFIGRRVMTKPIEFRGVAESSTIFREGVPISSRITTEAFSATGKTGLKTTGIITRTGEEGTTFTRESGQLFRKGRPEIMPIETGGFAELIGSDESARASFFRTGAVQVEGLPKQTRIRPTTSVVKVTEIGEMSPDLGGGQAIGGGVSGRVGSGGSLVSELKPAKKVGEAPKSALASSIGSQLDVQSSQILGRATRQQRGLRLRGAALTATTTSQSVLGRQITRQRGLTKAETGLFQPIKTDLRQPQKPITTTPLIPTTRTPQIQIGTPFTRITTRPILDTPLISPPTRPTFSFPPGGGGGIPFILPLTGGFFSFDMPARRERRRRQPKKYSPSLSGIIMGRKISKAPSGTLTGIAPRAEVVGRRRRFYG